MSEAVEIATGMVGCYPRTDNASPSYLGALAAVLVTYPAMIARKSRDPVRGVPAGCKFLPTPADVIAWCERETAHLRRPVSHADHFQHLAVQARERRAEGESWLKARAWRANLPELQEMYGPNWGLNKRRSA